MYEMKKIVLIVLAMVILIGCATAGSHYASGMSKEQITLILNAYKNGDIKLGMTKEEVINLIGEPSLRQSWGGNLKSGGCIGSKELWKYTSHNALYDAFIGFSKPLFLLFDKDDKLIELDQSFQL
jgi:hypothetical protein